MMRFQVADEPGTLLPRSIMKSKKSGVHIVHEGKAFQSSCNGGQDDVHAADFSSACNSDPLVSYAPSKSFSGALADRRHRIGCEFGIAGSFENRLRQWVFRVVLYACRHRRIASLLNPSAQTISVSDGFPYVNVPVLSKISVRHWSICSSTAGFLMMIPRRAEREMAPITATGMPIRRGPGVATTTTARNRCDLADCSPGECRKGECKWACTMPRSGTKAAASAGDAALFPASLA